MQIFADLVSEYRKWVWLGFEVLEMRRCGWSSLFHLYGSPTLTQSFMDTSSWRSWQMCSWDGWESCAGLKAPVLDWAYMAQSTISMLTTINSWLRILTIFGGWGNQKIAYDLQFKVFRGFRVENWCRIIGDYLWGRNRINLPFTYSSGYFSTNQILLIPR